MRAGRLAHELGQAGRTLPQAAKDALDPVGILDPGKLGLADRLGVRAARWPPGDRL